ncbi:hypothetical protein GCM10017691_38490 [Pseudonocardia petroleophila]|uniref:Uncharacterized protein n=1 Tax=Pseudonocardia petroleophila TaxID=37331 RepID=A0A7G7MCA3_9PSEU|nr:hypothetical protein [Pseudonocardia petroleophila]QNG50414.1 hypothetical protein H6H00_19495 [Pseudonocardia petroleophila]
MGNTNDSTTCTVFTVHVTRPDEVGAVEIVFTDQHRACSYAADRSRDHRILSASVTRFVVGQLGTRHPVAWFSNGVEQPQRFDRQLYPTSGHGLGTPESDPR